MPKLSELGQAAVWYCENGFAIIPLKEHDKVPATKNGLNDWFDDPEGARELWTQYPDYNIGIVCGTPSHGLLVLDFDIDEEKEKDGYATLSAWERAHGDLPETAVAITGSGGMHYLYRTDRTNIHPSVNHELGVDVRCDGSYIVAPPSIHPNGNRYEWQDHPEDVPIATANGQVYDFLDHIQRNGGQDETKKENGKFKLPEKIGKGERDQTLFRYACHLRAIGRSDEEILNAVMGVNYTRCDPPMSDDEVRKKVQSACRYERGEHPSDDEQPHVIHPRQPVRDKLRVTDKGKVMQITYNALIIIGGDSDLAGHFWFDSMAYTRMVTCPVPWDESEGERAITDEDYIGLVAYLEQYYGLTAKERIIDACIFACRQNERNPVTEWLDSLVWDGEPRVGTMVTATLGAEDNEYNREVERLFMLGAVSRAYEPGCKFDYMPVLVGPQGIGKSRYVSLLAHIPAWYNDNFNTIDGDAAVEKLRGLWIAEMAELLATKKTREVEAIKAFITSTKDVIRPKYARETVQRMRVCVFIGTTNDHDFLTDSTGNRRFLPVECKATECSQWMFTEAAEAYVEQMWAEIVYVYKTEHPALVLPKHLEQVARKLQEAHTEEHPVVTMAQRVADQLWETKSATAYRGTANERICMREVFLELPEDIRSQGFNNKLVREDIAAALDGSERWKRMDGKQRTNSFGIVKCWVPVRQDT